eukprot:793550_1
MQIWVYSNTYYVELFLNGESVPPGMQQMKMYDHLGWKLDYKAGSLSAVGYDINKKQIANHTIETTDKPYSVKLIMTYPANGIIEADGQDVAMIEAQILDDKNRFIGTANNLVHFAIKSGVGEIYGVGNGDPSNHQPDKGSVRNAFHGRARLIVASLLNKPGIIKVTAKSDGLTSDSITVESQQPKQPIHYA